jgi:predicted transglutaminase-like cysteine proteinase
MIPKLIFVMTAFIAGLVANEHGAMAAHPSYIETVRPTPPLKEGAFVASPLSFTKFCMDYPWECPSAGPTRVHMTTIDGAELSEVNDAVNTFIAPMPDTSAYRFWALNVSRGDCNEFALEKRHALIERGWPAGALALAVVKTARGEGHLVLTVRTDEGDFVLDNLRSRIVPWQLSGYHWIMRQSEQKPQYWVDLKGGRPGSLAALRAQQSDTAIAAVAARPVVSANSQTDPVTPTASSGDLLSPDLRRGGRGVGPRFVSAPPAERRQPSAVDGEDLLAGAGDDIGADAARTFIESGLRGTLDS